MLKCPYCGHLVRLNARRCLFCFRLLDNPAESEKPARVLRSNWRTLLIRALLILIVILILLIFQRAAWLSLGLR